MMPKSQHQLFSRAARITYTSAVIVATHDMAMIERYGKRTIRLEDGRVVEDKPATGRAA